MGKSRGRNRSIFWRISLTLIGAALAIMAIGSLLLFFIGDTATADVHTRRTGGSNYSSGNDTAYSWSIDYTFAAKNGKTYEGHLTRRGSPTSVRVSHTVYYLPVAPFINTLEDMAEPNPGQLVMLAAGVFLIVAMNVRSKKRQKNTAGSRSSMKSPADLSDYDDSVEQDFDHPAAHESAGRFCAACGNPLEPEARFCRKCGQKLL